MCGREALTRAWRILAMSGGFCKGWAMRARELEDRRPEAGRGMQGKWQEVREEGRGEPGKEEGWWEMLAVLKDRFGLGVGERR